MAARRTLALEGDPATIPPPTLIRQGEQLSAPSSAEPIELGRLHRLLQLMDLSLGPLQRSLDRPEPVDFERAEVTLAEDYERAREIYALASGLVRELERVPEGASEVRPLAVTRLSPNEPPGRQLLTAARVAFRARERPEEAGATLDDPVEGLRVHVVERDAPVLLGAGEHHGQQADRLWWESEEERNLH
jgi:hypothetical protein